MIIGIFTDTYLPEINGVVTSVELLRKKLSQAGHTAYVICTHNALSGIKYEENNVIRLPGIEVKKLYGYVMVNPIHFSYIEEFKKLNFDIIHAETEFGVGILANITSKVLNIPLVRTYHTTYEDYTHYVNILKSSHVEEFLKKIVADISKIYCDNCVKLIVPSKKTKEMLLSYGVDSDISVIPTGIELNRFGKENINFDVISKIKQDLQIKENQKLIIYVGRIAPEKSIDKIIDAFKLVKEGHLNIKLAIVGGGPSLDDLKQMCENLQLSDYVTFVGKVPFEVVHNYYHCADAFISASTSETQGMTYIEALASGIPVFAQYDEVLDDIVKNGKNGFFFNNAEDLYEKIKTFCQIDANEYARMCECALDTAKVYDCEKFKEDSIKIYEEAIEDYNHAYIIKNTKLRSDCVKLHLEDYQGNDEELIVLLDTYSSFNLKKSEKISSLNYHFLKKLENSAIAYQKCVNRIAHKDYSIKEMRDYMQLHFSLSENEKIYIINKLTSLNLLNDSRYAKEKIELYRNSFISKNNMQTKLLKAGISKEIIAELLEDVDVDLTNALKLAEKYQRTVNNKPILAKKQFIYSKLLNAGFNNDTVNKVVESLNLKKDEDIERALLTKEVLKNKIKYEKKYTGSQLKNKIFSSLLSKGFNYEDIYSTLKEMEINNDKTS